MSYKIEKIPGDLLVLGEGPHWDDETQNLYYIDIYNKGAIYRFDYKENKSYKALIENEPVVSFIIPVEGSKDRFAVGVGKRVAIIHWDGRSATAKVERVALEVEKESEYHQNRFNDAKADPKGRFFGGTMRLEEIGDIFDARLGSLYSFSTNDPLKKLKTKIGVSNGLAWNEKTNKFYYIDSTDLDVKEYSYDPKTGKVDIDNPKVIVDFRNNGKRPGFVPDGMTIDRDGNLYVATFGASKIFKINPKTCKIELEIKMPCENVTSCAFGGPNLDILYATTASIPDKPEPAGATFKITGLGVVGTKMHKVKL